ncbi:MAG: hypothetical protein IJA79_00645 [Desulfovibrio sp.]|nr:hypothetical protein [Desulfovibrio sp.]
MKKPYWATAKVKFYLATCWARDLHTDEPWIEGVDWINDKLIFLCAWYHRCFIQPFLEVEALPLKILEMYKEE